MTLGQRLRKFRNDRKLTLNAVAIQIGIQFTQLSEYELDKVVPGLDYLVKLADLYEVTLDELVGRKPP